MTCWLGAISTDGRMNPTGILYFTNRTLVEWMSGSCTQKGGIAFAEGFWDMNGGGISLVGISMTGESEQCHFSIRPWYLICS
jgi:hypothetical protein